MEGRIKLFTTDMKVNINYVNIPAAHVLENNRHQTGTNSIVRVASNEWQDTEPSWPIQAKQLELICKVSKEPPWQLFKGMRNIAQSDIIDHEKFSKTEYRETKEMNYIQQSTITRGANWHKYSANMQICMTHDKGTVPVYLTPQ